MDASNNSYTSTTPTITFDDNNSGAATQLITYNIMIDRSQTQNPAPYLEETRKPDTGFRGMRYVIKALFRGDSSPSSYGAHSDIEKIATWFKESSDIRGAYKNGRFGIFNERAPEFNIHPKPSTATDATRNDDSGGLKLVGLDFSEQIEYCIRTAIITLEQSGATSTIRSFIPTPKITSFSLTAGSPLSASVTWVVRSSDDNTFATNLGWSHIVFTVSVDGEVLKEVAIPRTNNSPTFNVPNRGSKTYTLSARHRTLLGDGPSSTITATVS